MQLDAEHTKDRPQTERADSFDRVRRKKLGDVIPRQASGFIEVGASDGDFAFVNALAQRRDHAGIVTETCKHARRRLGQIVRRFLIRRHHERRLFTR